MSTQLKEAFDEVMSDVKFDLRFCKALYQYQIWYINHNKEHLEFFGGNLLGVHIVRFKDKDVRKFFDEVLDVDYELVHRRIRQVTSINHDFKISSDIFNLTCMYVIHRLMNAEGLSDKNRHNAMQDQALIFFYRCMAAWLSDKITYPVDPKLAQAVYANLSNKFLIKKLGSWHKVMMYRAQDLIKKKGLHYDKLLSFGEDEEIVKVLNDSQGRIRDYLKNYYTEFKQAHAGGERIGTTSSTMIDLEGEETIKEKTRSTERYVAEVRSLISDSNGFIRDELVRLIVKLNSNSSQRIIVNTLSWMVGNYGGKHNKLIDEFISKTIIQSSYFIDTNIEASRRKDIGHVLIQLKNLYLSTRSTDNDLLEIRVLGEKILKHANGEVSKGLMLSTRTAIILYITLLTFVSIGKS